MAKKKKVEPVETSSARIREIVQDFLAWDGDTIQQRRARAQQRFVSGKVDVDWAFGAWMEDQHIHARFLKARKRSEWLSEAIGAIAGCVGDISKAETFDAIFQKVGQIADEMRLSGFGEMARYDIPWYLAAQKGLAPEKLYLHCGTRKGAIALGLRDAKRRKDCELKELLELPHCSDLSALSADQLEDLLCGYWDQFDKNLPFRPKTKRSC